MYGSAGVYTYSVFLAKWATLLDENIGKSIEETCVVGMVEYMLNDQEAFLVGPRCLDLALLASVGLGHGLVAFVGDAHDRADCKG